MNSVTFIVPGAITTRTGGSIYDRRIVDGLRAGGWNVALIELLPIAHPLAPAIDDALERVRGIPDGSLVVIDGLVFGTMPEVFESESRRLRFVPIVHMPLSLTTGLTPGEAGWLRSLESRSLRQARRIVTTGQATEQHLRTMLSDPDAAITRIPPGTARVARTPRRAARAGTIRLLCVANVTPGKGHDLLFRALAESPPRGWTLTCAGSVTRDTVHVGRLRRLVEDLDMASRVDWVGELDDEALAAQYTAADLFVLATRGETYGMAVAEAISHGLPVVSTHTGEIPSITGAAGLLAAPGDTGAFSAALRAVLTDEPLRQRMARSAAEASHRLPTWDAAVEAMTSVLQEVSANG